MTSEESSDDGSGGVYAGFTVFARDLDAVAEWERDGFFTDDSWEPETSDSVQSPLPVSSVSSQSATSSTSDSDSSDSVSCSSSDSSIFQATKKFRRGASKSSLGPYWFEWHDKSKARFDCACRECDWIHLSYREEQ